MPDSRETGQVEPSTKVIANALTGTECKFFSARIILWHFCFALFWLQTPRALSKFLTNRQTPISFMLLDAGNADSSLRVLNRL